MVSYIIGFGINVKVEVFKVIVKVASIEWSYKPVIGDFILKWSILFHSLYINSQSSRLSRSHVDIKISDL